MTQGVLRLTIGDDAFWGTLVGRQVVIVLAVANAKLVVVLVVIVIGDCKCIVIALNVLQLFCIVLNCIVLI